MNRKEIEGIVYGAGPGKRRARWTQDSPILLDVWVAYAEHPGESRQELLLTPHQDSSPEELCGRLRERLQKRPEWQADSGDFGSGTPFLLFNESVVLANLTLAELVEDVLPLSDWWRSPDSQASFGACRNF